MLAANPPESGCMKALNFAKKLISAVVCGLVGILSAVVFVFSLLTVIRFRQQEQNDLFEILPENVPLLLLSMAAFLVLTALILWLFRKYPGKSGKAETASDRPPFPWPMMITAGVMSLLLVLVIRGNATNDALQLDTIMQEFRSGNYGALSEGGYLFVYPFQITYVLIGEVISLLAGPSNYLVYQLLNVVSILCNLYFLYQICWEAFHDREVCLVMQLLSMGCWFYYVFATFIYADLWSFPFQTAALWLEILYLRRGKLRYEMGAGACIAAATLLKTNCYIALIAMMVILILYAYQPRMRQEENKTSSPIKKVSGTEKAMPETGKTAAGAGKRFLTALLLAVFLLVMTKGAQALVNAGAARMAGLSEMPSGVPSAAYFAMGMQETEGKYGWYNGTNVGLYSRSGYDREETIRNAAESMKSSIREFRNSGRYFVKFYAGKFLSQWGDPTCVSMREMEETRRHTGELPPLVSSLIFGTGSRILQWGMNAIHSLIYLGMVWYMGVILHRKRKTGKSGIGEAELLLLVFIAGGMLFHEIWEASGRYTMRYYLTMLPLASFGICHLVRKGLTITGTAEKMQGSEG